MPLLVTVPPNCVRPAFLHLMRSKLSSNSASFSMTPPSSVQASLHPASGLLSQGPPFQMNGCFSSSPAPSSNLCLCCDPVGQPPLGSGAGTVHAMMRYFNEGRHGTSGPSSPEISFSQWLKTCGEERIAVVHAGGLSRRLPSYSALGKLMVPFVTSSTSLSQHIAAQTLMTAQCSLAERLLEATPSHYTVCVLCGDVRIDLSPPTSSPALKTLDKEGRPATGSDWLSALIKEQIAFARHTPEGSTGTRDGAQWPDVLCLGLDLSEGGDTSDPSTPKCRMETTHTNIRFPPALHRHGVFVLSSSLSLARPSVALLQKPSAELLHDWRWKKNTETEESPLSSNRLLLDIGVWFLSEKALQTLHSKACKRLPGSTPPGRVVWQSCDLYTDLLPQHEFLPSATCFASERLSVGVCPLTSSSCSFYHFGTTRDLLHSQRAVSFSSSPSSSTKDTKASFRGHEDPSFDGWRSARDEQLVYASTERNIQVFNTGMTSGNEEDGTTCDTITGCKQSVAVDGILKDSHSIFMDNCLLSRRMTLTHHHVLTGTLDLRTWRLTLPPYTCVEILPVRLPLSMKVWKPETMASLRSNEMESNSTSTERVNEEYLAYVLRAYHCEDTFSGRARDPATRFLFGNSTTGSTSFLEWCRSRGLTPNHLLRHQEVTAVPELEQELVGRAWEGMDIFDVPLFPCVRLTNPRCTLHDGSAVPHRPASTPAQQFRSHLPENHETGMKAIEELLLWMISPPPPSPLAPLWPSCSDVASGATSLFTAETTTSHAEQVTSKSVACWEQLRERWINTPRLSAREIRQCVDVDAVLRFSEDVAAIRFSHQLFSRDFKNAESTRQCLLGFHAVHDPLPDHAVPCKKMNAAPLDLDALAQLCVRYRVPFSLLETSIQQAILLEEPGDGASASAAERLRIRYGMTGQMFLARVLDYTSELLRCCTTSAKGRGEEIPVSGTRIASALPLWALNDVEIREVVDFAGSCMAVKIPQQEVQPPLLLEQLTHKAAKYRQGAFELLRYALVVPHLVSVHRSPSKQLATHPDPMGVATTTPAAKRPMGMEVLVQSAVRIDLCGGWTDTPPYGVWHEGGVVHAAIEWESQPPPITVRVYPIGAAAGAEEGHNAANFTRIRLRSLTHGKPTEEHRFSSFDEVRQEWERQRLSGDLARSASSVPLTALVLMGLLSASTAAWAPSCTWRAAVCSTSCGKETSTDLLLSLIPHYTEVAHRLEECFHRQPLGIEMNVTIPSGSGLGTSSVLAVAVLQALRCYAKSFSSSQQFALRSSVAGDDPDRQGWHRVVDAEAAQEREEMASLTLLMEQLLGTGGGWQDAFGGCFEGLKFTHATPPPLWRCETHHTTAVNSSDEASDMMRNPKSESYSARSLSQCAPTQVESASSSETLPTLKWETWPHAFLFEDPSRKPCHVLYFTGITRIAKHILQEIVEDMFLNEFNGREVLQQMKELSEEMRALLCDPVQSACTASSSCAGAAEQPKKAEAAGDALLERYGACIARSWILNKALDPGVTTPAIDQLLTDVSPFIYGAKLCGAGGGGFLYLVAKSPTAAAALVKGLQSSDRAAGGFGLPGGQVMPFRISRQGMRVYVKP